MLEEYSICMISTALLKLFSGKIDLYSGLKIDHNKTTLQFLTGLVAQKLKLEEPPALVWCGYHREQLEEAKDFRHAPCNDDGSAL